MTETFQSWVYSRKKERERRKRKEEGGRKAGKKKTIIRKDTCTLMSIAALFTVGKIWKWPKCPSIDYWINKIWYIHTVEYYSPIKRN